MIMIYSKFRVKMDLNKKKAKHGWSGINLVNGWYRRICRCRQKVQDGKLKIKLGNRDYHHFCPFFCISILVKFYGNCKFSTVLQKEDGLFVDASGRLWIQHSWPSANVHEKQLKAGEISDFCCKNKWKQAYSLSIFLSLPRCQYFVPYKSSFLNMFMWVISTLVLKHILCYCVVPSIMLYAISRCVSFVFTPFMQLDDWEMCIRYVINQ